MQTPGLPASKPTSAGHTTNHSAFKKPTHAGEAFGDVMSRTLNSGTSAPPVRPDSHPHDTSMATDHDDGDDRGDEKSSAAKSKKALRHASDEAPATLVGITVPSIPSRTPNSPGGNPDDSPKGKTAPEAISADTTENTEVTNADPTQAEPSDPATESAPTALDPKLFQPTDALEQTQKTPPPAIAEQLAVAVEAVEDHSDPAESTTPGDSNPQAGQVAEAKNTHEPKAAPSTDAHGTPAAKQDVTMKKADKMQKVAGPAEQDLPGMGATGSEELPQGQKLSAKAPAHGEKPDLAAIELPTRISTSVESPAPTVTAAAVAPAPSIDSRVLERTHDIVALHAMRLNDTGSDSLRVVVKPGAGIQLSLELRQSARGIEVSAELHKGDYQQLNQHWSDLQQRLEARGVRVGTLTTAENYTGGDHQHFNQSKQQSPNQDSLQAGAFAEFALSGSMTEAPAARAARATAYRGWETWA